MVNAFLFSLCLVPILIWTENPLILQRRPFFFVCLFVCFGLYLCLDRERVPPRNPAPGATILSTATGNDTDCLPILAYVNLFQNKWLTKPGCSKTQTFSTFAFLASFIYRGFFCLKHNTVRTAGSYSQTLCQLRFQRVK